MSEITVELPKPEAKSVSFFGRLKDSDLLASFLSSKVTVLAGALTLIFFLAAILAPLIAPTNPFDPASNFLIDSLNPPRFVAGGDARFLMRIADVQLTFPAILIALLVDGVVQALLKGQNREETAFGILVVSIGLSFWVQYASTVRGSTLVEKKRDGHYDLTTKGKTEAEGIPGIDVEIIALGAHALCHAP